MNDEKKIGFSVELENNRVDLWAHGDDETLVNLAVAALANIVAAACQNAEGAKALLQDKSPLRYRLNREEWLA